MSLKYIHPMFEFHDVAKKSRFFEFQTFSSRLLLTYSHILWRTLCCLGNNLGISPFAWEEWQEVEKGKKRCWPHTTHASHQESAKPLQGFCCFQQHITSRNKSPWRYLGVQCGEKVLSGKHHLVLPDCLPLSLWGSSG